MKQIHINIDLDKDDNICDIEDNIITEAAKQIIDIALKQDIFYLIKILLKIKYIKK